MAGKSPEPDRPPHGNGYSPVKLLPSEFTIEPEATIVPAGEFWARSRRMATL